MIALVTICDECGLREGMMLSKEGQRIKQSVLLTAQRSRGWTISYKRAICPKCNGRKERH